MRYDPEKPPAPDVWKALDEDEAELMITRHHRSPRCAHPPAPSPRLHTAMHLVVENQAATSDLPIAARGARLRPTLLGILAKRLGATGCPL